MSSKESSNHSVLLIARTVIMEYPEEFQAAFNYELPEDIDELASRFRPDTKVDL